MCEKFNLFTYIPRDRIDRNIRSKSMSKDGNSSNTTKKFDGFRNISRIEWDIMVPEPTIKGFVKVFHISNPYQVTSNIWTSNRSFNFESKDGFERNRCKPFMYEIKIQSFDNCFRSLPPRETLSHEKL